LENGTPNVKALSPYNPAEYRAYPGPPDIAVEQFVRLARGEDPRRSMEEFLRVERSAVQMLAGVAASQHYYIHKHLQRAAGAYLGASERAGSLLT